MTEQAIRVANYDERDKASLCYWKAADGSYLLYFPAREGEDEFEDSLLANLANHTIEEHEDGTISVTLSIQTWRANENRDSGRHGYLTKGVWYEC